MASSLLDGILLTDSELSRCRIAAVALAFALCLKIFLARIRSKGPLPPGPPGLPLLGNLFQIPKFQWIRFTEWKEQFGPIFSLNFVGQPVIVLNSYHVASELLERRSNIYSDRPHFIMSGEILTGGLLIALIGYSHLWRKLRRAAHEGLNTRAVELYQPLQEAEAVTLVSDFLKDPGSWDDHLRRSAASGVVSTIYGRPPIQSKDDPIIKRINDFIDRIACAALPGAYLVEIFPIMRYLPTWMAKWKADGLEWHRNDTAMLEGLLDDVRHRKHKGLAHPCFATHLLDNKAHVLPNKEAAWLAGAMFGAGAETTAATLSVFIQAMVLYPEVMKKAQDEIDEVVGPYRMPTFADRDRLPYIGAIVKEVLRWRPVGPLGVPRRALEDDWYNGYFIPKGTLVICNAWAMNRDPSVFPDFDEFRPERFLDASGKAGYIPAGAHPQGHCTFGFGRRICSGMNIANQTLFIDIASLLWAVNIEPAFDVDGNPIFPSRTDCVDEGLVVRPLPFKCQIYHRSKDRAAVVDLAMERIASRV